MDEKTKELILFTLQEKINSSNELMEDSITDDSHEFHRAQNLAYAEIHTMIENM